MSRRADITIRKAGCSHRATLPPQKVHRSKVFKNSDRPASVEALSRRSESVLSPPRAEVEGSVLSQRDAARVSCLPRTTPAAEGSERPVPMKSGRESKDVYPAGPKGNHPRRRTVIALLPATGHGWLGPTLAPSPFPAHMPFCLLPPRR
jgi:hypothetical protein